MHISTKVEKCLVEVILEVYKNLLANPAYTPPSSREMKTEVTKRLNAKYPGEKLKIALGTVQARLQKLFGPEIYEKHYTATISDEVERFLKTQAMLIKAGKKDPQYIAPKTEQIIESCKIVTGQSVSPPTVHDRFQKLLGRELYSYVYPKIILPVNVLVDKFFENKAKELLNSVNSAKSLEEIAEECYLTTGFAVGYRIMTDRLRTHLGEANYFQLFTKKSSSIDKSEQVKIGAWWIAQAERMLSRQTNEVETISAYIERSQRDYATIRKYGEKALKHEYGETRWRQIYLDLTAIQRENWAIGFVNHQLLERIFQRGFIAANQKNREPKPEMFREVNLTAETRCDLILADIYRGGFMEACMKRGREAWPGAGNLLGMPPDAARRYIDAIIDLSTRHGQDVLKDKVKYCDGKTFVIVACTGDFPPDVPYIRNPDYQDMVEVPALDLGRFINLPEEYLAQITEILELTRARDWEGLRDRLLADRARHPGEIDWETRRYRDYISRRDTRERKEAEAVAFRFRLKEKGQQVLDTFYAKETKDGNSEHGQKCENRDHAKQEFPLTGKVGNGWILDLLNEPVEKQEHKIDPFFEMAGNRVSFRRKDIKEQAEKIRVEQESVDIKSSKENEQKSAERRKERDYEHGGERFHAF